MEEEFAVFQSLAQEILEAKAESFSTTMPASSKPSWNPCGIASGEFQAKVEETHTESMAKIQFLEHMA